ncbi:MAG: MarR family transcriptional regulator [Pseudomonadota bacterium]
MEPLSILLESCLFFNTNALSRNLLKLAQMEFNPLDISPAHASLMLLVYDNPGISPKKLSQSLHLTPSTITRFMDVLVKKDLLIRKTKGKLAFIYPSANGLEFKAPIAQAYIRLYDRYTKILGTQTALRLSHMQYKTNQILAHALNDNE